MFPLSTVLFPHAELPLHVFEPRYQALVHDVLEGQRSFGTVLITSGSEVGGGDSRVEVGTRLSVEMAVPFEDGRWLLVTRGLERIRVTSWLKDTPYPVAMVEAIDSPHFDGPVELLGRAAAAVRRVRMLLSELDEGPCAGIELGLSDDLDSAAWMVCALAPLGLGEAQELLELSDPVARLDTLIVRASERARVLSSRLSDG